MWVGGHGKVVLDYMLFGKGLDVIKGWWLRTQVIWILGQIIISSGEKRCGEGQRLK